MAEDAAVIYSFMSYCKVADVDFKDWMNYFLNHVHEYDSDYSSILQNTTIIFKRLEDSLRNLKKL